MEIAKLDTYLGERWQQLQKEILAKQKKAFGNVWICRRGAVLWENVFFIYKLPCQQRSSQLQPMSNKVLYKVLRELELNNNVKDICSDDAYMIAKRNNPKEKTVALVEVS